MNGVSAHPSIPAQLVASQGSVEVRATVEVSVAVEVVPNADKPIWPGSSRASTAQRGRGEPGADPALEVLEAAWAEFAARSVGRLSLNEVKEQVTTSMLKAALARSHGNYTHTARLLGITRQAVQYLMSRHAPRAVAAPLQPRSGWLGRP